MRRDELGELLVFSVVAEERSFTRAAARLATSQSALSQTVRRLEERLGVRLLTRNTRSVATTDAGQQLLDALHPAFDAIDTKLTSITQLRDKPAGAVRITAGRHAVDTVLWPALQRVLLKYPDVELELSIDAALTDIVASRFDAGVRLGEHVAQDMIAVRVGPDIRMAVVGAPAYFADKPPPVVPHDLTEHSCINLRLPSAGGLYVWQFGKDGRDVQVRVGGRFVVNDMDASVRAAEAGLGLANVMEDLVETSLAKGTLLRVLDDWCPPFPGYHIYYPSRRQLSSAFQAVLDELRHPRRR